MRNLEVILVRPRFPENVGMVARACANMGCDKLTIVKPEIWNLDNSAKTATPAGVAIISNSTIVPTLEEALACCEFSWAATARTGGWRRDIQTPAVMAQCMGPKLLEDKKLALVLGNEKNGLTNNEIIKCTYLVRIPSFGSLSSFNLAQSALILLYECAKMVSILQEKNNRKKITKHNYILQHEKILLETRLKELLIKLHCCHGQNPDYLFIQWHNMLTRMELRRHEFDAWMGFCRQISNFLSKKEK